MEQQSSGGSSKKSYEEWEKELRQHPAFMEGLPDEMTSMSEAIDALQAMKYDDDDDTPEDKANIHKLDGNKHFKLKKYRWAIDSYTEGIKQKCCDTDLNAVLFANRAAANFYLGNFRSAFRDCFMARKLKPDYAKAVVRGAECLLKLNLPFEASKWVREYKNCAPSDDVIDEKLTKLAEEASKLEKIVERNQRKQTLISRREKTAHTALLHALKSRRIPFAHFNLNKSEVDTFDSAVLNVDFPGVPTCSVKLTEDAKELIWPVLFLYPEFNSTDFVQEFRETDSFEAHLAEVLSGGVPGDSCGLYNLDTVDIFFAHDETIYKINPRVTLQEVLQDSRLVLRSGLPTFILLAKSSGFYQEYCSRHLKT